MFPNMEYIKTLVNGLITRYTKIEKKLESALTKLSALWKSRPDWNQNDPSALDYVKNRTHWAEMSSTEEIFNSGEITVTDTYYDSSQFYYSGNNLPKLSIVAGDKYRVEIAGLSFDAISDVEDHLSWKDGNGIFWDIGIRYDGYVYFVGSNSGVTSIPFTTTVKITHLPKEIAHPIPEKFIPETIARKNDIPELFKPPIARTSGSSVAYTATFDGITSLYAGLLIIAIPHVTSASTAPTLNLNNTGAKTIALPSTSSTSGTSSLPSSTALKAGYPVLIMYNGFYWIVLNIR